MDQYIYSDDDIIMVDMYDITRNPTFPNSDTSNSNPNPSFQSQPPLRGNLNHMNHLSHSKTISSLHKSHTATNSDTLHTLFDSKLGDIGFGVTDTQRPSLK